jgi:hypothetical protein
VTEAYLAAGGMLVAMVAGIVWLERYCPSGIARKSQVSEPKPPD